MKWFLLALQNYANFNGRSRRKEYWMFLLFNIIFALVFTFLDGLLFGDFVQEYNIGLLNPLYSLVMFIPGLAVLIRRLHDTGRSGWFWLISLIPIVGWVWIIVVLCADSDGPNQYGPNPKETEPELAV